MEKEPLQKRNPLRDWLIPFLKFNLIGILNTLIDNGLYALFYSVLGWHFALSKTLSYGAGMVNSWLWNSRWTFVAQREEGAVGQGEQLLKIAKFLLVNGVAYLSQMGVLWLCRRVWGSSSPWMSLFIATPVSLVVNFLGNRLFVFKSKE